MYIYLTDAGPLRFKHMTGMKIAGEIVTRPAVKAGEIRFGHSALETHSVEYLGDTPMKYLRVELRTRAPDALLRNIRIQPPVMQPDKTAVLNEFENGQVRILRVICAAGEACPASRNPDDPALVTVMSGPDLGAVRWSPRAERGPLDEVRIEFKTGPLAQEK